MYCVLTLYTIFKLTFMALYIYNSIIFKYITGFSVVLFFMICLGLNIYISMSIISILWIVFYKLSITNINYKFSVFMFTAFLVVFFTLLLNCNGLFITEEFKNMFPSFSDRHVLLLYTFIAMALNGLNRNVDKFSFKKLIYKVKNLSFGQFFLWIFMLLLAMYLSDLFGIDFIKESVYELVISVFSRLSLLNLLIKIPLEYISKLNSNNKENYVNISIDLDQILAITLLAILSYFWIIPYIIGKLDSLTLNSVIKFIGILLKSIGYFNVFKPIGTVGKCLINLADHNYLKSLPEVRYKKFSVKTAEFSLAVAKDKHLAFWKSIPKFVSVSPKIVGIDNNFGEFTGEQSSVDVGFNNKLFWKMIYLANKNVILNKKGVDSIIESKLELVNIDKPLVKEGAEKLLETKNLSGLSKYKHSFREELLNITAPSKEGNSIIVYSLHGINNNLNLEETNNETMPLTDNRYFDENGQEILSDVSSTDYDAPDTQVINTAHPNSNLRDSNPLIGQEGNPDMPVTNFNYNFYDSFYNTPQVNTGQTDPAFGTFSLYSENNQITNTGYHNPNLGQANLNLAGQQVNTNMVANIPGQSYPSHTNYNPINATYTYPVYTVNNAIGGNGPGGQVSRDVHLSNEYRIQTDTSLLLDNRELSHLLNNIIDSLLQDRGGVSSNVKFSDLNNYLKNSYYIDKNKYYSYNINNNSIRLYYYYLMDKSLLWKIDGDISRKKFKILSVQDRLISMYKIWVEEGRSGRTVVPDKNLSNQNIDNFNINSEGFLEWLENQPD